MVRYKFIKANNAVYRLGQLDNQGRRLDNQGGQDAGGGPLFYVILSGSARYGTFCLPVSTTVCPQLPVSTAVRLSQLLFACLNCSPVSTVRLSQLFACLN
jgi:hypothetical protein